VNFRFSRTATDRYAIVSVPACIDGARRGSTFDPQSKLRPTVEFEAAGRLGLGELSLRHRRRYTT
jgi:hypothetical protein